jgi:trans-aconitate methyltransferase
LQIDPFKTWASWRQTGKGVFNVYNATIHDYGCAHGDGTAVLKSTFPMAKVCGVDLSEEAIEQARYRWPTLEFRVGDIRDPQEEVDFIYTSHTIEHLVDPPSVINNLLKFCRVLVVVVPTITDEHDGGHVGAMETSKLIDELESSVGELTRTGFTTMRDNVEETGHCIVEANNMFVIAGEVK